MGKKGLLYACLLLIIPLSAYSQDPVFEGVRPYYCRYDADTLPSTPYLLSNDDRIERIVDSICTAAGYVKDFKVLAATVSSVVAMKVGNDYFLLYSKYFTRQLLNDDPYALHLILAHEIGHIFHKHSLDGTFKASEESEADEFAGRSLFQYKQINSLELLLNAVNRQKFAYDDILPDSLRTEIIRSGWNTIDQLIRSEGVLGYFDDEEHLENLTLPYFDPIGCPKFDSLHRDLFTNCKDLEQVNQILCKALDKKQYHQRRYYSISNGFALITPVEQTDVDGISYTGEARWKDYPVSNNTGGILQYLKSILIAQPGYFRLFAFVVTDEPIVISQPRKLIKPKIKHWLNSGGFWLPNVIATQEFGANFRVTVLVYEFEASKGQNRMWEACESAISAKEHLRRSGLFE